MVQISTTLVMRASLDEKKVSSFSVSFGIEDMDSLNPNYKIHPHINKYPRILSCIFGVFKLKIIAQEINQVRVNYR